jgi:hypothetical protein
MVSLANNGTGNPKFLALLVKALGPRNDAVAGPQNFVYGLEVT